MLKTDGYPWDDSKAALNTITKSCKLISDTVKIRLPIQINLLEQLMFETNRKFDCQPFLNILYKTVLCIGYYRMMRIGEMASGTHPVRACDIHIARSKNKILLILRTSKLMVKSHYLKKSRLLNQEAIDIFFCPFKLMRQFMVCRGGYEDNQEPLFVFSDGTPISPDHVRKVLRDLLKRLNLDPLLYDTTSLRSGQAVDMYKMGYSISEIKAKGRWKSNAVYCYLKL